MKRRVHFERFARRRTRVGARITATLLHVQERLVELVADPFARLSGESIVSIPVDLPPAQSSGKPSAILLPGHPRCAGCTGSDACLKAWRGQLAKLVRLRGVHWHRCPFNKWCAVVPVVRKGHCVAICKLVCPGSHEQAAFERAVELLDILVDHFEATEDELLALVTAGTAVEEQGSGHGAAVEPADVSHPRVREALDHIHRHLPDATMTVAGIARHLDINATYLAHLFSQQVGMRMRRYIVSHRMELAKKLLATTNWQIKRVAFESGHAHPDWFSEAFHTHTGLTPSEYRHSLACS